MPDTTPETTANRIITSLTADPSEWASDDYCTWRNGVGVWHANGWFGLSVLSFPPDQAYNTREGSEWTPSIRDRVRLWRAVKPHRRAAYQRTRHAVGTKILASLRGAKDA